MPYKIRCMQIFNTSICFTIKQTILTTRTNLGHVIEIGHSPKAQTNMKHRRMFCRVTQFATDGILKTI